MIPKVSIIIPVYNGSNYLKFAIDSALSQNYSNFEVIVVNDGSNDQDATKNIALKYSKKIRYFEKENGGVATALNLGISKMEGDFFSWLSHDDLYYPDKLEKQIDFYHGLTDNKVIVFSNQDIIDSKGRIQKSKNIKFDSSNIVFNLLIDSFIGGCSLLIPKQLFSDVGIFNPALKAVQDYDLWFRALNKGYIFKHCPITSNMSRIHFLQDSIKKKNECQNEYQKSFSNIIESINPELILIKNKGIADSFYSLGFQYKKRSQKFLYLKSMDIGDRYFYLEKHKIIIKIKRLLIKIWSKYFSIYSYYRFIKNFLSKLFK